MEVSRLKFIPKTDYRKPFDYDERTFFRKFMLVRDLRCELDLPVELTLRSGRVLSGVPLEVDDSRVLMLDSGSQYPDFLVSISLADVCALGVPWNIHLSRYFSSRQRRPQTEPLGSLALSNFMQKLSGALSSELKINIKTDGEWQNAREEDLFILEDYLVLIVRALMDLNSQFPAEMSSLKMIAFRPPQESLKITAAGESLVVQLPFESSEIFTAVQRLKQEIEKVL